MRKRVALKIIKYKDKLRYRKDQIREAERVAARFGKSPEAPAERGSEPEASPAEANAKDED